MTGKIPTAAQTRKLYKKGVMPGMKKAIAEANKEFPDTLKLRGINLKGNKPDMIAYMVKMFKGAAVYAMEQLEIPVDTKIVIELDTSDTARYGPPSLTGYDYHHFVGPLYEGFEIAVHGIFENMVRLKQHAAGDHQQETDADGTVWQVWHGERIISSKEVAEKGERPWYPWDKEIGEKSIPLFVEYINANYDGDYDADKLLQTWMRRATESDNLTEEEK